MTENTKHNDDMQEEKNVSPEDIDTAQEELTRDDELEQYKQRAIRAQADYQNLQKEIEKKRSHWVAMSEIQVLENFIPVYDNFVKAYTHKDQLGKLEDTQWQNWVEGIGYIKKQFEDKLKEHGIELIKTVGEQFNPEFHEAAGEEEGEESGVILREIDCGYKKGDIVIRPAKVIITK